MAQNQVVVRGLLPEHKQKKEESLYLYLSYRNNRYLLNDPEVNEDNFFEIQSNYPDKVIGIRKYFLTIKVPISKVHIRAMTYGNPYGQGGIRYHSQMEEDD